MANIPYDVGIVGTGPAGMFAAMEIIDLKPGARIVMFEKGPVRDKGDKDNVTAGWGGAGAFSDGKLDHSHVVGGTVHEEIGLEAFNELLPYIDDKYVLFGGDNERYFDASRDPKLWKSVVDLKTKGLSAGLDLRPFPIRHLGTDTAHTIVMNIKRYLEARGVVIRTNCPVKTIEPGDDGKPHVLVLGTKGAQETVECDHVLVAPGRAGAEWFAGQAKKLGLRLLNNGIDIGVRVEVLNETLAEIAKLLYESKVYYYTTKSDDRLRTFCMCPSGIVAIENYRGLKTVNGHSKGDGKSKNTNFAILATQVFTAPFDDPLGYGKHISESANLLAGGGVLVQRLGDLRNGRRSKAEKMHQWIVQPTLLPPHAIPGDLGLVIPHRHLSAIVEFLDALEVIAPGIASQHTLLYGIEVKFYSFKLETDAGFETKIPRLFVAGDGSGYTRGLVQASMQGVLVGRSIVERLPQRRHIRIPSTEDKAHEAELQERFDSLPKLGPGTK